MLQGPCCQFLAAPSRDEQRMRESSPRHVADPITNPPEPSNDRRQKVFYVCSSHHSRRLFLPLLRQNMFHRLSTGYPHRKRSPTRPRSERVCNQPPAIRARTHLSARAVREHLRARLGEE